MTAHPTFFLRPLRGLFIPQPDAPERGIPAAGMAVPDTRFYRRYVQRGEAAGATTDAPAAPSDFEMASAPQAAPEDASVDGDAPAGASDPEPPKRGKSAGGRKSQSKE